jgi:hypothetical protein
MSGRQDKKIRKEAKKRFMAMMTNIGELPFWQRMRLAWRVLRGK